MRSLFALVHKDFKGYLDQPTGYILIVLFVGVISWFFFVVTAFGVEGQASVRNLFTMLPWILLVLVPASTMRLLAEEQRDGTLETLLTQPIRAWVVLIAKFLSGLAFVAIAILATLGIPILVGTAGNLDEGGVIAQYVGSLFLAASFVSIGLFTSSLTRNQIVAFIVGLAITSMLMLIGLDAVASTLPDRASTLVQTLSPVTHFDSIARGVIDLRDVLYFIALVSTFLSAAFLTIRSKSLSHQSPQYRNLQLGVTGLIVFAVLVGWFGSSIEGRLDLTEDQLFTLSPGTAQILSELDDLLTIKFYASKDPPTEIRVARRDVSDFLDDFAAQSGGKVKLVRRTPNPEDAEDTREAALDGIPPRQFNVRGQSEIGIKLAYLGLSMTYADSKQTIPFISTIDGFEYRLASLANNMIIKDRKTVAFLTGHGEKAKDSSFRFLERDLVRQYDVVEIEASDDTPLDLSGIDVLIVSGPTERISKSIQDTLHSHLANGGKMMVMVDSLDVDERLVARPIQNNFAEFLEPYGVIVENNIVFDVRQNETLPFSTQLGSVQRAYPFWPHVPTVDTKVTGEVESALLPWTSSLGITSSQVGAVEVIPLLRTSPSAAVDYAYGDVTPNSPQLDVSGLQQFESDIAVAITPKEGAAVGSAGFRLVVVADSDWLTDGVVNRARQNLALGRNLIDWLAQEDTLASVRSKVISSRRLDFDSATHENLVRYANIVGVPLLFVLVGLARFLRRRAMGKRVYRREE